MDKSPKENEGTLVCWEPVDSTFHCQSSWASEWSVLPVQSSLRMTAAESMSLRDYKLQLHFKNHHMPNINMSEKTFHSYVNNLL